MEVNQLLYLKLIHRNPMSSRRMFPTRHIRETANTNPKSNEMDWQQPLHFIFSVITTPLYFFSDKAATTITTAIKINSNDRNTLYIVIPLACIKNSFNSNMFFSFYVVYLIWLFGLVPFLKWSLVSITLLKLLHCIITIIFLKLLLRFFLFFF